MRKFKQLSIEDQIFYAFSIYEKIELTTSVNVPYTLSKAFVTEIERFLATKTFHNDKQLQNIKKELENVTTTEDWSEYVSRTNELIMLPSGIFELLFERLKNWCEQNHIQFEWKTNEDISWTRQR